LRAKDIDKYIIMGELSLDGGLQPRGAMPLQLRQEEGFKGFSTKQNVKEAAMSEAFIYRLKTCRK
jgi:magnesium chelatase family protein